jgi:predicted porin
MKKHLIAAAVAGALAVPAMAQVTISGRIDTSVQSVDNGTDTATAVNPSLLTTNQIVISGSEDLGGGLKARFVISSPFNSSSNSDLDFGQRGMAVYVGGGFGEIEIGRTPGTMFNSTTASGVTGNMGNLGTRNARPNNVVGYTTPSMGGVTARVVHGVGVETPGATANDDSQTEVSVEYKGGPVLVRLAHAKYDNTAAGDLTETGGQIDYDFGMAKVNARYMDREDVDKQYGVGVAVPLGSGLTASIDYRNIDADAGTESTRTSATLVKALSKRTNVYAAYYKEGKDAEGNVMAVGVRHAF